MNEQNFDIEKYKFVTKKTIKLVENKNDIEKKKTAILFLNKELKIYNVDIKKLYSNVPEYNERNKLLNIAFYVINNEEVMEYIYRRREIPYIKIANKTGVNKKFILKYKEYILLYILILNKDMYRSIKNYLAIVEEQPVNEKMDREENDKYTGLTIKKNNRYAIILTSSGEIIRIKNKSAHIGYEVAGYEKKGLSNYSRQIVAVIMILAIAFSTVYYVYNKSESTILISGTSSFRVDVNKYSKVIKVVSKTEKGNRVLSNLTYKNENIDYVLNELVNEMIKNNMIPDDSQIEIIVSGERLNNSDFRLVNQTIKDNNENSETNIKLIVNNNGLVK